MHAIASELAELGWYTECTPARFSWPYAIMWGDHASGARLFVRAGWSSKPGPNYTKQFSKRKYSFWFSPPPPSPDRRSLWYPLPRQGVPRQGVLLSMAADPMVSLPSSARGLGFIPSQHTGCGCDKIQLYGEQAAAEALASAQAAREAGMERRRECRFYQCPDDARAFHLTSREAWEPEGLTPAD